MKNISHSDRFSKQAKSQHVESNADISSADMAEAGGNKWQPNNR
jgi:hypothetical protein